MPMNSNRSGTIPDPDEDDDPLDFDQDQFDDDIAAEALASGNKSRKAPVNPGCIGRY